MKGSRSSLGQLLHVRAEHDRRRGTRAASLGLLGRRRQPAFGASGSRRRAAARASARARRSSTAAASRRSAGVGFAVAAPRWRLPRSTSMLPSPPHCATSRPPGRKRRVQAREQPLVVGDPVEGGRREDRVDGLVQLQLEQVDQRARRRPAGARARRRPSTARRRRRSRGPRGRRSINASVMRPEPQPASSTVSSPRRAQTRQHLAPELPPSARRSGRSSARPSVRTSGIRAYVITY